MSLAINHAQRINKKEAMNFLKKHNSFLLVGHIRPDGDDVGSMCALHNVLESMGKDADMLLGDPVPEVFLCIETAKLIKNEIPKNKKYDAMVFTDLANLKRAGDFDFPDVPSLCIDHHKTNEGYTDYLYLEPDYAAAAQLLAEMFFDENIKMDKDTCNALYMALCTDSGFFKFSCTSAHTLLMASKLVEMGAEPAYISRHLDAKSKEYMQCYTLVANSIRTLCGGKLVTAKMDKNAMELDGENSDRYVDIPRCLKGTEIAILLKYQDENTTRISLRSVQYADVSEIAAKFGGGGHARASGCTISKPMNEAEKEIIKIAEKYL